MVKKVVDKKMKKDKIISVRLFILIQVNEDYENI